MIVTTQLDLHRADARGADARIPPFEAHHESSHPPSFASHWQSSTTSGTCDIRHVKDREVISYSPPCTTTFYDGIDNPLSKNRHFSVKESTVAFLKEQLNIVDASSMKFRSSVSSDIVHSAVVDQAHDDIPFYNASAAVTFDHNNKIIVFGSSFVKLDPARISPSKPTITLEDAVKCAEDTLEGMVLRRKDFDLTKYLGYLVKEDRSAVLVYVLFVRNAAISRLLQAFVDAHSGDVVTIHDLVSHSVLSVAR